MKSMKWRTKIGLATLATLVLAGAAFALTFVQTFQGTLNLTNYDGFYQEDFPNYTGQATVQFQELTMKPGDAFPWHYHEGLAYVILTKGTLTEDEGCGNTHVFHAGSAFVEMPGTVHRVINNGPGAVILYWAVMYPSSSVPVVTQRPDGSTVAPSCG